MILVYNVTLHSSLPTALPPIEPAAKISDYINCNVVICPGDSAADDVVEISRVLFKNRVYNFT